MTEHAFSYKVDWNEQEVVKIEKKRTEFVIKTDQEKIFSSKAVIVAAGAVENELKVKGEKEFTNQGVSYCAICDGFLFTEKEVVVVGGGYSALEAALYLSNIAKKIYLIHRRDSFRAELEIVEKVKSNSKITLFLNSVVIEIGGKKRVEKVIIQKLSDNSQKELLVQAVFPCVGLTPYSHFIHQLGVCDFQNYIRVKTDCSTSVPGLFAAGDIARSEEKKIKQIVTAISEGAVAAQSAIRYLNQIKK
ncbi:MAG: thioredoxin reductase [Mycoplasmataceae bacterium RC_NB112A]|nr:MAG: thioredoxin reductase [Mycoplasmataceae bacterium RC_NB112A]